MNEHTTDPAAPGVSAQPSPAASPSELRDPLRAHTRAETNRRVADVLDGLLDSVDAGELSSDTVTHAYVLGARDALRLAAE